MAEFLSTLQNLGFPEILLWLLSFAIVYGVMSQAKIPDSKPARAIIAIVVGFLVIFSAPTALIDVLSKMSTALVLVVLGILVLLVFLEIAGIKHPQGSYMQQYAKWFAPIFIIIAILVFVGAGGLQLIGLPQIDLSGQANVTLFFFIVIILAIVWMLMEKEQDKTQQPQGRGG